MASPVQEVRATLVTALKAEFGADWSVRGDRLHNAVGTEGNVIGISPITEEEADNILLQKTYVLVQIHGWFDPQIDPLQQVDPTTIENRVDRARLAIRDAAAGSPVWYMRTTRAEYPSDPTGNATRANLTILAWSENNAQVTETTGP